MKNRATDSGQEGALAERLKEVKCHFCHKLGGISNMTVKNLQRSMCHSNVTVYRKIRLNVANVIIDSEYFLLKQDIALEGHG